jgi:chromosome partitioning protein
MYGTSDLSKLLEISRPRIKQLCSENEISYLKMGGNSSRIKFPHSSVRSLLSVKGLNFKKKIVTIGQEKGGIGKSLLTFNIASNLSFMGARVLIIDLDPEACTTNVLIDSHVTEYKTIYEVIQQNLQFKDIIIPTKYEGLDLVGCKGIARRAERLVNDQNPKKILRERMEGLLDQYDLIMFDIPPSFSRLISSAYLTSDLVVMPTFPDSWSIESLQLTLDDLEEECSQFDVKIPEIKIVMNKYLPDRKASQEAWKVLVNNYGDYLLPFQIRESAGLQNTINDGISIFESSKYPEIKEALHLLSQVISPLEGLRIKEANA